MFPLLVTLYVQGGMCEKQHIYSTYINVYLIKHLLVISTEGAMWVVVTIKVHPLLAYNTDHLHNNKNDTITGPLNRTL